MINTAKMSFSNIIMYLLPIVVTPILSRLYSPDSFGEWGVFSSFITILTVGLFLGLDNTIVKAKDNQLKGIIALCLFVGILVSLVTGGIFLIGNLLNLRFFATFPCADMLFLYLFFYVLYTIFFNLCNRFEMYGVIASVNVVQGLSQSVFRILLGMFCVTAINGLIIGTTIAEGVSAILLVVYLILYKVKIGGYNITRNYFKKLLCEYKNFPLYDAPSSVLAFAAFNLPTIILAMYFDKASIGCFSIVLQLLLLPMSFIGNAIGKVYYQEICKDGDVANRTNKVVRITAVISFLPMFILACGGDKIVVWFLGSEWETAGNVALCLSLWSFPTILTQPLIPLFRALNSQRYLLLFDVMYFICGIGSILVCCQFIDNLFVILIVYAVVCAIVKLMMFMKIIKLGNVYMASWMRVLPLWLISCVILLFRLL